VWSVIASPRARFFVISRVHSCTYYAGRVTCSAHNALLNANGLAAYEIPLAHIRIMAALEDMKNAQEHEKKPFFQKRLRKENQRAE